MSPLDHEIRWWRESLGSQVGVCDDDLDELEDHLRILIQRRRDEGASETEAFRWAADQLADVEERARAWVPSASSPPLRDAWESPRGRRLRPGEVFWSLLQDAKFGLRTLASQPGYSSMVVLILALGIGMNSAVFSLIHSLLWRPPNLEKPEEIVVFASVNAEGRTSDGLSHLDFLDYEDAATDVVRMALHFPVSAQVELEAASGTESATRRYWGNVTSLGYFEMLGVDLAVGRPYDETTSAADPVVVISHALWESQFASASSVLGQPLRLNDQTFTIAGVAPSGFRGAHALISADFWVPLDFVDLLLPGSSEMLEGRKERHIWAVGRLQPGVTLSQAQVRLQQLAGNLEQQYPESNRGVGISVFPESHSRLGMGSGPIIKMTSAVLLVSVGLVLLIACVNVANLVLVRGAARRREISIRLAMGASRGRVVRQLLTESLLLAGVGGLLGLSSTGLAMRLLGRSLTSSPATSSLPIRFDPTLSGWVLFYALVLTLATVALFGLVPALRASKAHSGSGLRSQSQSQAVGGRLRRALVAAQVAACLVLLVTSALFARSLQNVVRAEVGFETEDRMAADFDLTAGGADQERQRRFFKEMRDAIASSPGVDSASWALPLPLGTFGAPTHVYVDGYTGGSDLDHDEPVQALYSNVDGHYFETLGTRIVSGRAIQESDREDSLPVAVVNETMAKRFWAEGDALGKTFRLDELDGTQVQIVGIAADGKYRQVNEDPIPYLFLSHDQRLAGAPSATLVVHSSLPEITLAEQIRQTARQLDESVVVLRARSLQDQLRNSTFLPSMIATGLVSLFGLVGLGLAVMGLYGVLSYTVSQQTSEIGLRMAIGATRTDVLRMVLGSGMKLTAIGVLLGVVASLAVGRLVVGILYNVSALDAVSFLVVPPVLAVAALSACWLPAMRATRIEPTLALRNE